MPLGLHAKLLGRQGASVRTAMSGAGAAGRRSAYMHAIADGRCEGTTTSDANCASKLLPIAQGLHLPGTKLHCAQDV